MVNLNENDWDALEPLNKAAFLLRLEKSKTFIQLDNYGKAERELYKALKIALQLAERAENEGNKTLFIEAINSFKRLLVLFEEHQFMQDAWAEIYLVVAVCYHHINLANEAKLSYQKSFLLEPENQHIQEMGRHYGWLNQSD